MKVGFHLEGKYFLHLYKKLLCQYGNQEQASGSWLSFYVIHITTMFDGSLDFIQRVVKISKIREKFVFLTQ